jgi:hypothetical protein
MLILAITPRYIDYITFYTSKRRGLNRERSSCMESLQVS